MLVLAAAGGALALAIAGRRPGLASALAGAALITFVSEAFDASRRAAIRARGSLPARGTTRRCSVEAREAARTDGLLAGLDPGRRRTALILGAIASVVGVLEFLLLLFAGAIAAGFGVMEGMSLPFMLFIVLAASVVGAIGAALVKERPGLAGGMLLVASFGLFGGLVSAPLFLLAGIIALTTHRPRLTASTS
jgi:hypothetical protein